MDVQNNDPVGNAEVKSMTKRILFLVLVTVVCCVLLRFESIQTNAMVKSSDNVIVKSSDMDAKPYSATHHERILDNIKKLRLEIDAAESVVEKKTFQQALELEIDALLDLSSDEIKYEKKRKNFDNVHAGGQAGNAACEVFLDGRREGEDYYPSSSSIWIKIRERILDVSHTYSSFYKYPPTKGVTKADFENWIDDIYEYYTVSRLRKTRTHPANPNTIRKLLAIIEKRMAHFEEGEGIAQEEPPPLHIMTFGGSVPFGHSSDQNPWDLEPDANDTRSTWTTWFNWSRILERMFNEVFFGGKAIVKITNMAQGGTNSAMGALLMEYQAIPREQGEELPHIIINSYPPNESDNPMNDRAPHYNYQPSFIEAANKIRPCDDDLPLIVFADHPFGYYGRLEHTTTSSGLYKSLAIWFDLMAFDQGNVALHELTSNWQNKAGVSQLFGTKYQTHYGFGFHLGMAWTALFNFLDAFVENCNDMNAGPAKPGKIETLLKTPSLKNVPNLLEDQKIGFTVDQWNLREKRQKALCSAMEKNEYSSSNTKPCEHAWVIINNKFEKNELNEELKQYVTSSKGWAVAGNKYENPREGWYARAANATFDWQIPITEVPVKVFSIVSMKSYGPSWRGSKLQVTAKISHRNATMNDEFQTYTIDGYQTRKFSEHYDHKFKLPGEGALVGDVLTLSARLVGGRMFKILGMAFCRY